MFKMYDFMIPLNLFLNNCNRIVARLNLCTPKNIHMYCPSTLLKPYLFGPHITLAAYVSKVGGVWRWGGGCKGVGTTLSPRVLCERPSLSKRNQGHKNSPSLKSGWSYTGSANSQDWRKRFSLTHTNTHPHNSMHLNKCSICLELFII